MGAFARRLLATTDRLSRFADAVGGMLLGSGILVILETKTLSSMMLAAARLKFALETRFDSFRRLSKRFTQGNH